MKLSMQQRHFWFDNGFLVLSNFIPDELIQRQIELKQSVWGELDSKIVVDDLDTSVRLHLKNVPEQLRGGRYKVNDLSNAAKNPALSRTRGVRTGRG